MLSAKFASKENMKGIFMKDTICEKQRRAKLASFFGGIDG